MKATPDMFDGSASTVVGLCSDFERIKGVGVLGEDGWPQLSPESQLRLTAFGIVACGGVVEVEQLVVSGGLKACREDGSVVDESEAVERAFDKRFAAHRPEGLVVVKDGDCSTTKTSAMSVGKLLREQQTDPLLPFALITSRAHARRAKRAFQAEDGLSFRVIPAEGILLNAGLFGWGKAASADYAGQATDYIQSWHGRRMELQQRVYGLVLRGSLEDIAERRVLASRAGTAKA